MASLLADRNDVMTVRHVVMLNNGPHEVSHLARVEMPVFTGDWSVEPTLVSRRSRR